MNSQHYSAIISKCNYNAIKLNCDLRHYKFKRYKRGFRICIKNLYKVIYIDIDRLNKKDTVEEQEGRTSLQRTRKDFSVTKMRRKETDCKYFCNVLLFKFI